eukprot:IDg5428t1
MQSSTRPVQRRVRGLHPRTPVVRLRTVMDRRRVVALAAVASAFSMCAAFAKQKRQKRTYKRAPQPRYPRRALLRPISSIHTTAWRQILSCGSSSDFLVTLNLDRATTLDVLLPMFEEWRKNGNGASNQKLMANRPNGRLMKGIFAVVDGGRIPCADYVDADMQNAYYEGYTGNVEVTNLLVFNFFGEIIHAGVNFPGSWHDSKLAVLSGLIYPKLGDDFTPPGYAILGDSAFASSMRVGGGKIVRARKQNETVDIPESPELAAVDLVLQRVLPSERQSAEWGIRALKGPFERMRLPLSAVSTRRGRLLRVCVHLLNMRTRLIGLSQIRTTYSAGTTNSAPWVTRMNEELNGSVE